jgi:hypothetical protein
MVGFSLGRAASTPQPHSKTILSPFQRIAMVISKFSQMDIAPAHFPGQRKRSDFRRPRYPRVKRTCARQGWRELGGISDFDNGVVSCFDDRTEILGRRRL